MKKNREKVLAVIQYTLFIEFDLSVNTSSPFNLFNLQNTLNWMYETQSVEGKKKHHDFY